MNNYHKAMLAIVFQSIFCVFSDVFFKQISANSVFDVVFLRYILCSIVLIRFVNFKFLSKIGIFRSFLLTVALLFFLQGLKMTNISTAIVLSFATFIWIIFLSKIILKEKIGKRFIPSFLGLIGIFIACYKEINPENLYGIISLFISTFFFALVELFNKMQMKEGDYDFKEITSIIFWHYLISAAFTIPFLSYTLPNFNELHFYIATAICAIGIFYTNLIAVKNADLSSIQTIKYLEFPLSVFCDMYFFNQIISKEKYIGFIILIFSIFITLKMESNTN